MQCKSENENISKGYMHFDQRKIRKETKRVRTEKDDQIEKQMTHEDWSYSYNNGIKRRKEKY